MHFQLVWCVELWKWLGVGSMPGWNVLKDHDGRGVGLLVEIKAANSKGRKTFGSPRIYEELSESGYAWSRYRVARLMRQHGIIYKPNLILGVWHHVYFNAGRLVVSCDDAGFVSPKNHRLLMDRWIAWKLAIDRYMAIKNEYLKSRLLLHSGQGGALPVMSFEVY